MLRETAHGWTVARADGRMLCEPLGSFAAARLIGRTFAMQGRVWVCRDGQWSVLDDD